MGNGHAKPYGPEATSVVTKSVSDGNIDRSSTELATFAAGCFWGVEISFQRVPGVLRTEVGYTQGHKINPTYEEVCSGTTGHTEAVQITYDPSSLTYDELLTVYWDRLNPTTLNRQGGDSGTQYRSGIYYHNNEQKELATASAEKEQKKYADPIVTEILPAAEWYPAEAYHQQYLKKVDNAH
eukprot:CAMPEP_0182421826 /NCGR_PEP_ID=MMETSP1167-20130531/7335_1 /TAXON_ID=2988 /ORGANISM="Mallomonas Sp, Strain CCMP3275" /LENGTH=181 /DNA_ID=CAMNT_0024599341 /DNA_START=60 /DNA_END=606 /DNA_ORIENTATION=-